jgi:hypothetical protein
MFTQTPHHSGSSFFALLRDPAVRAGIYAWLVIAGVAVIIANAAGL